MRKEERENKINKLTNAQAISIVRLIKDKIEFNALPNDYSLDEIDPVDALHALYHESSFGEIDKNKIKDYMNKANEDAVGQAAKDFLLLIAKRDDKDLLSKLGEQLNNPPNERTAVIDPGSLLTVVFAGVGFLTGISGIRWNGKFTYDPQMAKDVIKTEIDGIVSILQAIIPIGPKK